MDLKVLLIDMARAIVDNPDAVCVEEEVDGYEMKTDGYNGWLSLEYERRWHPDDIPDASIGMKQSADYLKNITL